MARRSFNRRRWIIIVSGCVVIGLLLLFLWLFHVFSFIYFIILAGFVLGVSTLFPYHIGVAIRKVSYVFFFLGFLLIFGVILQTTIKKEVVEPSVENCANFFFPTNQQGSLLENALLYTSCILTGKFPKEQGSIGWGVFFLFYLFLPFIFILTLLLGLTEGIGLPDLFGGGKGGKNTARVLSVVISVYAARALVGAFILEYIGYGVWGLAALVGSVFLTAGIRRIVENFFEIEKQAEEIQQTLATSETIVKTFSIKARPNILGAKKIIEDCEKGNVDATTKNEGIKLARNYLLAIQNIEEFKLLPQHIKSELESTLETVKSIQDWKSGLKEIKVCITRIELLLRF